MRLQLRLVVVAAAFFTAFESEFGASRGHIALVFSVAAFAWFVCGAPGGVAADRFGPRRVALASVAGSVTALYVTYSVGIGLGVGLVYVPSVGAVQPWFDANRAFASGLAVAGIGAGNIAGSLLAAWWIDGLGWLGRNLLKENRKLRVWRCASHCARAPSGCSTPR